MFRLLLVVLIFPLFAPAPVLEPISAETVAELAPARRVAWEAPQPEESAIPSGWFTLSPDGTTLIAGRGVAGATLWDTVNGQIISAYGLNLEVDPTAPPNLIDADFSPDSAVVAALHGAPFPDWPYGVFITEVATGQQDSLRIPNEFGYPFRVWFDSTAPERYVWLEFQPDLFDPNLGARQTVRFDLTGADEPLALPSGPENDTESIVRIGRIPAPLAITAAEDGSVRLWDLETNTITAEITLPVAPTFGRVNQTEGVHFVWRDGASDSLYLLDFTTGENTFISPLDGEYIQALLISPLADVVLAVHRGDTPSVGAWLVETGEYLDLGSYWEECSRVPDSVALSADGTRLIIGCNAGYEVWEIPAVE